MPVDGQTPPNPMYHIPYKHLLNAFDNLCSFRVKLSGVPIVTFLLALVIK